MAKTAKIPRLTNTLQDIRRIGKHVKSIVKVVSSNTLKFARKKYKTRGGKRNRGVRGGFPGLDFVNPFG